MRLSTGKHHDQFLRNLAEQMQTEPSVALDYILWTVRRQGFSFGLTLPLPEAQQFATAQQTQPAPQPGKFTPFEEVVPQLQGQEDEVVQKFAMLIEEF